MIKHIRFFIYTLMLGTFTACTSPGSTGETDTQNWYKGNLHAHSFWSDGDDFPEMIMDWYKSNGYDFAVLSDHNILAEGEKWTSIGDNESRKEALKKYRQRFGDDWVETREDTAGLEVRLKTLEEYRTLLEKPGEFLIIQSEEISDRYEDKPIHVNATNVRELIEPQGGDSVVDVMQNNIDAVNEQRERTGVPMIPHINHPNFGWAITIEDLKQLEGERFFEVYNGHPHVHNFGDDSRPGTDEMWDEVLTVYLLNNKPPLYGLAVDDSHHYHEHQVGKANPGRGWVMVGAEELTPASIIEALEAGDFYATTGVEFDRIEKKNKTLSVRVREEPGVSYKIMFIGSRTSEEEKLEAGTVLKEIEATEASYTLQDEDLYVRALIISDKLKENPFEEGEKEMAWVQPLINE